ncbi:MAG: LysR family transcriptional regulator [Geminicoccaceae bacterium]|nr:LysR family transcriptional regulator [Geminicoccaceae bacterium]
MPAHGCLTNLRHLGGFLAIAGRGTISAAAESVAASQPALTQALAGLEARLGVPLFDRRHDGMVLTEPGRILRVRVERCTDHLRRAMSEIGARPHLAGQLSMSRIRALIAVAEEGSLRMAARACDLRVSSISRSCRDLELRLGVTLLERTSTGLGPTRRAEQLARLSRLALAELREAEDELRIWRGEYTGRLAIGCLPLAQSTILPAALARFTVEYPRIDCSIVDGYYATLSRALGHADIDLIIGALRRGDLSEEFEEHALFGDELVVVARKGHALEGRHRLTLADLHGFSWIAPRTSAPAREYFERLLGELPQAPAAAIETGAHSVMRGLLRATDRLTLVSLSQVRDDLTHGLLCQLDLNLPPSARIIGYTHRRQWLPNLPQQRFLEILRSVVHDL